MYYYKFRVYYDEVEDFIRDIEILSSDNFESFHNILFTSIGLTGNELAAFSVCDTKWNKQKEITLIDMGDENMVEPEYEEGDDYSTKSNLPKFVMKDAIIKDFITDPHQHIIYEYNFINPKIFYIELLKTLPAEENVVYPRCSYKMKELPKESAIMPVPSPEDEFIEDENTGDDDFQDGYNDEDHLDLDSFEEFKEY